MQSASRRKPSKGAGTSLASGADKQFGKSARGRPDKSARGRPDKSARAFEDIAKRIRAELSSGALRAGDRLPAERELAARFGVSRNTVREALRSLENAGLLSMHKGAAGGAFIREGGGDAVTGSLRDLFHLGAIQPQQLAEARLWMDSVVVRAACRNAGPDDLADLQANIVLAEAAHRRGDHLGRNLINMEFHRILARIAGNPVLVIFMDAFSQIMREFVVRIGPGADSTLPARQRFMRHFARGDAERAVLAMEQHLKRIHRGYMQRAGEPDAAPPVGPRGQRQDARTRI